MLSIAFCSNNVICNVYHTLFAVKKERPRFLKKPSDQEVQEESDARFEASVSAKPQANIEWFIKDKKLEPSDRIIYETVDNVYTLTIKQTLISEAGNVVIKATNSEGTLSASAKLIVIRKYSILLSLTFMWCNLL